MRADSALLFSCASAPPAAPPALPCRAAAATACGSFHCARTVARLRERSSGIDEPLAAQKVEIAALVGLRPPLDVEPRVAARRLRRRLPRSAALGELGVVNRKINPAFAGIERDDIAV